MPILALNKATVKLITSTQIITSVSSVVKELVENSLDADAKNIEINLTDNGLSLIEIRDDGCGISIVDVPNMAMPHYTSKILDFSDLDSLTTYGFRGEALNAICRVADVTITTKTIQDETAKLYTMDNEGGIRSAELSHRFVGTTVRVQKLFENLPVRRQMMSNGRKSKLEIRQIENILKTLSICQPVVRMSFRVNNSLVFLKPSCANIREAMSHFVGSKVAANLEWIQSEDSEVKLQLMIPKKNFCEYDHNEQFVIVNNRPVKHKQFEKTIHERVSDHFGGKAPSKKHLVYLLTVTVSPSEIDVNLEPNKTSVFLKNQDIILKKLDKILVDYYNVRDENVNPDMSAPNASLNESSDYLDFTSNVVSEVDTLVCKKMKLNNNKQKARDFIVTLDIDSVPKRKGTEKRSPNDGVAREINPSLIDKGNFQDRNSLDGTWRTLPAPVLSDSDDGESISDNKVSKKAMERSIIIGHAIRTSAAENESVESSPHEISETADNPEVFFEGHGNDFASGDRDKDTGNGCETLSQLPVVDLGEDFDIDAILERCAAKELVKNEDVPCALSETPANNFELNRSETDCGNNVPKRSDFTLEQWSRGQIPGLKNPTHVSVLDDPKNRKKPTNESQNKADSNSHTIYHTGFSKFSYEIRSQVLEENPGAALPAIGKIFANRWKELSPEERGYYRDLALEEKKKTESDKKKLKNRQVSEEEADKNKARLVQMLESMKKTKTNKKCGLNEKTSTPWDINIQNITKSFFSKSICEEDRIVGALTDEIWALKYNGKVCVVNSREILETADPKELDEQEISLRTTASILETWMKEKKPDSSAIIHPIHSVSSSRA